MWGGIANFRYALISLAPYSFHYDQSKAANHYRLLQYFIALRDLHNFHVPAEYYQKFFREEYLSTKLPLEPFDLNNPHMEKLPMHFTTKPKLLEAYKMVNSWSEKNYPETRTENIKILDDYLTLCEENHIRPIMFLTPMIKDYMEHFNQQKMDEFYYLNSL